MKSYQPRRVIELIQTIERALHNHTEPDGANVIKNLLMTRSIESKLPSNMKRDWVRFMRQPSNGVTAENYFNSLLKYLKDEEATLEHQEQREQPCVGERVGKGPIHLERKCFHKVCKQSRVLCLWGCETL